MFQDWHHRFGTSVLVPPHNYIDVDLSESMARRGISVCRAITDYEVALLGFDPQYPDSRLQAKRASSFRRSRQAVELFQTMSISSATMAKRRPESVADSILNVGSSAGVAVVTFHWWDFAGVTGEPFAAYARRVMARLDAEPEACFTTISTFAATLPPETAAVSDSNKAKAAVRHSWDRTEPASRQLNTCRSDGIRTDAFRQQRCPNEGPRR